MTTATATVTATITTTLNNTTTTTALNSTATATATATPIATETETKTGMGMGMGTVTSQANKVLTPPNNLTNKLFLNVTTHVKALFNKTLETVSRTNLSDYAAQYALPPTIKTEARSQNATDTFIVHSTNNSTHRSSQSSNNNSISNTKNNNNKNNNNEYDVDDNDDDNVGNSNKSAITTATEIKTTMATVTATNRRIIEHADLHDYIDEFVSNTIASSTTSATVTATATATATARATAAAIGNAAAAAITTLPTTVGSPSRHFTIDGAGFPAQTVATFIAGNKNRATTIIVYPTVSPESIVIPIVSCIFGFPILALIVICCLRRRAKLARERDRRRNYDMQDHAVSLVRFSPIHRLNYRSSRAISLRPERSLSQGFTSLELDTVLEERCSDVEQTQTEVLNPESPMDTTSYKMSSFSSS